MVHRRTGPNPLECHHGSNGTRSPAPFRLTDPAEAGFIEEQEQEGVLTSFARPARNSGSCFICVLNRRICLGVPCVRGDLAPAMPGQEAIDGGLGNCVAHPLFQGGMDRRNDQHSSPGGRFNPESRKGRFLLRSQELVASAAPALFFRPSRLRSTEFCRRKTTRSRESPRISAVVVSVAPSEQAGEPPEPAGVPGRSSPGSVRSGRLRAPSLDNRQYGP